MSLTRRKQLLTLLGALLLPGLIAGPALAQPEVSGFVDTGYSYNFNNMPTSTLRTFDAKANSINVQNAEIVVSGTEEDFGYRVDVDYGYDASQIHSAGFITQPTVSGTDSTGGTITSTMTAAAGTNVQVDIQQAYLTLPCPFSGGTVTVGKFVTLHGAEVIEAKDNFNMSRGLLFNYAIPFSHVGVKYDKGFMDGKLTTTLALVNGWDTLQDNNKGKSFHGMVGVTPVEKVFLSVGGTYGPEQASPTATGASTEKNARGLVDTLLKVTPSDKLTVILNHDWGVEEGLAPAGTDTTQNWAGLGVHVNYAWTDMVSTAVRWETFDDEGTRAVAGTEQVLNSATVTLQCKKGNLIKRLEYRQDGSSQKVFADKDGLPDDAQSTIGAQVIYSF